MSSSSRYANEVVLLSTSIGPDLKPTYPKTPDPEEESCKTATANICTTTLSYGVVAKRSVDAAADTDAPRTPFTEFRKLRNRGVTTTTTSTISFCTKVTGCGATAVTETSSVASTAVPTVRVVIPRDPRNVDGLRSTLQRQLPGNNGFYESQTNELGTVFFFIPSFTDAETDAIRNHAQVADAYIPRGQLTLDVWGGIPNPNAEARQRRGRNGTEAGTGRSTTHVKRAELVDSNASLGMVLLSWPPNTGGVPVNGDYKYDSSAGEGTYVYSLDFGAEPNHPEFSEIPSFTPLFPQPFPVSDFRENDPKRHGTGCLSKAAGKTVGIARKARLTATIIDFSTSINEHWLDGLSKIHQDIYVKGRGTTAVVNLSLCLPAGHLSDAYLDKMGKPLRIPPTKNVVCLTLLLSSLVNPRDHQSWGCSYNRGLQQRGLPERLSGPFRRPRQPQPHPRSHCCRGRPTRRSYRTLCQRRLAELLRARRESKSGDL